MRTNIAAIAAHTDPVADPDLVTAGHQDSDDIEGPPVGEDPEDELEDDPDWTETPVDVGSG